MRPSAKSQDAKKEHGKEGKGDTFPSFFRRRRGGSVDFWGKGAYDRTKRFKGIKHEKKAGRI
jgi:hypothetical protein